MKMEYRDICGIDKTASRLVYGLGNDRITGCDSEDAMDCISMAWEHGFTVFDTANCYGNSEQNLGKWLVRNSVREKLIILDKGCNPGMIGSTDEMNPQTIRAQVALSLERMETEYIDMYILHRDDESKEVGPIVEVLNELKESGKIRKFGGSNWKRNRVEEFNDYATRNGLEGFTAVSPCYNMVEMKGDPWGGSVSLSGKDKEDDRRYYLQQEMPIFAYSSLARGFLSGKYKTYDGNSIEECLWDGPIKEYYYPENVEILRRAEEQARESGMTVSQIALKWLLTQALNVYPIVSPSKEKHMVDNIGVFDFLK